MQFSGSTSRRMFCNNEFDTIDVMSTYLLCVVYIGLLSVEFSTVNTALGRPIFWKPLCLNLGWIEESGTFGSRPAPSSNKLALTFGPPFRSGNQAVQYGIYGICTYYVHIWVFGSFGSSETNMFSQIWARGLGLITTSLVSGSTYQFVWKSMEANDLRSPVIGG